MKKHIGLTETACRDAQQSLIATRMTTDEMLPILGELDSAGYHSLEVWGGATFDACLRFLNEDPWERLRKIKAAAPKTKLQMLLRGQNLLGYKHYADDVVDAFIKHSIENGIDIIRVFDALNDLRNVTTSIDSIKKYGGEAQIAVSYTTSDIHTIDYYVDLAKRSASLGADSLCLKDMAGVMTPHSAYTLVSALKDAVDMPIHIHAHSTGGISSMAYLKAAEAGADVLDTAISPMAGGTSQPATESAAIVLKEMGFDTGLDLDKLSTIANYFKPLKNAYAKSGLLNAKVMDTDPKVLLYQVPGGMLSNLLSQLKEAGAEDKYDEVLLEVPRVRADLGFPPLVTPLSQMVGTQAVMNVISGERYKLVPTEIKEYVKGLYGMPPVPIADDIRRKIIGRGRVVTVRPADRLSPEMKKNTKAIGALAKSEEDVLLYAMFPEQAREFLARRDDPFYDVPLQTIHAQIAI